MIVRVVSSQSLLNASVWVPKEVELTLQGKKVRYANRCLTANFRVNSPVVRVGPSSGAADTPCLLNAELPTVYMSSHLQQQLGLPAETCLHLQSNAVGWVLGPCVGVYVRKEADPHRIFGEQTQLLSDLIQMGRHMGVDVVVLTPGFWREQRGWRFQVKSGDWEWGPVPYPDLIFRRSGAYHQQESEAAVDLQHFRNDGRLHTLPRICGDKWRFYQDMRHHLDLATHLPQSARATSGAHVWALLKRYRDVYVKPLQGAQGLAVVRLVWQQNRVLAYWEDRMQPDRTTTPRRFHLRRSDLHLPNVRTKNKEIRNLQECESFLRSHGLRRCIVQKTVVLPYLEDQGPYDFRWLIQFSGEPRVMARVARVGRPGSVTTNIHTGGVALPAIEVMRRTYPSSWPGKLAELDHIALKIAKELKSIYGPFAEVGIDLALNADGETMVFEINPTPGRRMLRTLDPELRQLSLTALLEYAISATGFHSG